MKNGIEDYVVVELTGERWRLTLDPSLVNNIKINKDPLLYQLRPVSRKFRGSRIKMPSQDLE